MQELNEGWISTPNGCIAVTTTSTASPGQNTATSTINANLNSTVTQPPGPDLSQVIENAVANAFGQFYDLVRGVVNYLGASQT